MTSTLERPRTTGDPVVPRRTLPRPAAFALLASVIVFFLAASSAPTPLYGTYQQMWHFSPITTTVVFGVYALAVLAALLVVGRISDHVGRRPVLLWAIALQMLAMIVLLAAQGVGDLMLARVLQGLATGAAAGAVGAGLLDLYPQRGTLANAVSAPIGTATGSLVAALFVQYLPAPTHLIYAVLLGIFVLQFVGVLATAETVTRKPGALASLRPDFAVPSRARGALLIAAPALVAGWSIAGLYGALGPALVANLAGSHWLLLGGLPLFVAAGTAALAVVGTRQFAPVPLMRLSAVALAISGAIALSADYAGSLTLFFLGAVIGGLGFGGAFQASVKLLLPLAHPHERAGLLSVIYTVSYLAFGLPAVIAGWLVVHEGGLLRTAREYSIFVIALGVLAFAGLLRHQLVSTRPRSSAGSTTEGMEKLLVE